MFSTEKLKRICTTSCLPSNHYPPFAFEEEQKNTKKQSRGVKGEEGPDRGPLMGTACKRRNRNRGLELRLAQQQPLLQGQQQRPLLRKERERKKEQVTKMFFVVERWESVALRPAQLGPEYLSCIEALLRQQVEGKCLQSVGYVVCVIRVLQNMPGRIQDSTGFVVVAAKYQAIVFKPFKEEVLDAVVTDVNKLGLFAQCGPLKVFVSRASLPSSYTFQEEEAVPSFSDGSVALRTGGEIRLKLLGVRFDASQIFAVATINADYLGPIESQDAAGS
ncbi:hypothetical protein Esti_001101 [Eimeria stiedai]